jgi:hypothetical protein
MIFEFNKYISYILGFIWADGCLQKNIISLECKERDIIEIEKYFNQIKYKSHIRKRTHNKESNKILYSCDKEFINFLFDHDYKNKSYVSPLKILNLIPKEYHNYFYLGWFDGDGCIYINKKSGNYQLSFAGTFEQDWGCLEDFFKFNGINKYKIIRVKNKTKYSQIRITNKKDIIKIRDLFYCDDELGLRRKKEKFYLLYSITKGLFITS